MLWISLDSMSQVSEHCVRKIIQFPLLTENGKNKIDNINKVVKYLMFCHTGIKWVLWENKYTQYSSKNYMMHWFEEVFFVEE